MKFYLKDIRKMTNADIRLHIKLEKVALATYRQKDSVMRHIKNLSLFEQVADERKIAHQ